MLYLSYTPFTVSIYTKEQAPKTPVPLVKGLATPIARVGVWQDDEMDGSSFERVLISNLFELFSLKASI